MPDPTIEHKQEVKTIMVPLEILRKKSVEF
jgi:hypothetical protein